MDSVERIKIEYFITYSKRIKERTGRFRNECDRLMVYACLMADLINDKTFIFYHHKIKYSKLAWHLYGIDGENAVEKIVVYLSQSSAISENFEPFDCPHLMRLREKCCNDPLKKLILKKIQQSKTS